jgi:hypothetical protein
MLRSLKLVRGLAEIFGCELAEHKEYTISGTSVAVFTYHGAHVEVLHCSLAQWLIDRTGEGPLPRLRCQGDTYDAVCNP